jgi:hypothetical protein
MDFTDLGPAMTAAHNRDKADEAIKRVAALEAQVAYLMRRDAEQNAPRNPNLATPIGACMHCKQKPCMCAVAQSSIPVTA